MLCTSGTMRVHVVGTALLLAQHSVWLLSLQVFPLSYCFCIFSFIVCLFLCFSEPIFGYKRDASMLLKQRVGLLLTEVDPFVELGGLRDALKSAFPGPATTEDDIDAQVTAVEQFFIGWKKISHKLKGDKIELSIHKSSTQQYLAHIRTRDAAAAAAAAAAGPVDRNSAGAVEEGEAEREEAVEEGAVETKGNELEKNSSATPGATASSSLRRPQTPSGKSRSASSSGELGTHVNIASDLCTGSTTTTPLRPARSASLPMSPRRPAPSTSVSRAPVRSQSVSVSSLQSVDDGSFQSAAKEGEGTGGGSESPKERGEEYMPTVLEELEHKINDAFVRHDQEVLLVSLQSLLKVANSSLQRLTKVRAAKEYWQKEQHAYNKQVTSRYLSDRWLSTYRKILRYRPKDLVVEAIEKLEHEELLLFALTGVLKSAMSRFSDAINLTTGASSRGPRKLVDYQRNLKYVLQIATEKMGELNEKKMGNIGHAAVKKTESLKSLNSTNSTIVKSTSFLLQMASRAKALDLHPVPSMWERHPYRNVFMVSSCIAGAYAAYTHGGQVRAAIATARVRATEIILEHLVQPVDNIFNKRHEQMVEAAVDRASLEESRGVLTQMLSDYVHDQHLPLSEHEVQLANAENCETSVRGVWTDNIIREVRRPLASIFRGDIVRLLLIDAERMKFDALVAINKMNQILHANFINIEAVALLPMLVLAWALYKATTLAFEYAFSLQERRLQLNRLLREVEQTLIKLDADHSNTADRARYEGAVSSPESSDFHQLTGRTVYSVWRMEDLLMRNPEILSRADPWGNVKWMFVVSFLGSAAGVVFGSESAKEEGALRGFMGGFVCSCLFMGAKDSGKSSDTEVARQFVEDLHELTPPRLGPRQKISWFKGLWRSYELAKVVAASRA